MKAEPTSQEAVPEETEEAQTDKGEEAQNVPSTNGSKHDQAVDVETDPKTTFSSEGRVGQFTENISKPTFRTSN